jgi:hypothetical protein
MSYSVSGTTITLTRGDSFMATISIINPDGTPYIASEGDKIRFALGKDYNSKPLIIKDISIQDYRLIIEPDDTKLLDYGTYVYDVQLTKSDGTVDTFITKARLKLTEEVE